MGSPRDLYADRNTPCMGHFNLPPRPRSEPVSRRPGTFDSRLIVRTKRRISGKRHDLLKEARIDNSERSKTLNAIPERVDRKSTRLNSSHVAISYAVFCLKNKTRP